MGSKVKGENILEVLLDPELVDNLENYLRMKITYHV